MKLKYVYFTDVHIKGVNPGKRKDIFYISILKKLMEIKDVVKNSGAKFVVIGGDLFDLPKISNQLLGEVAKIIKSWGVKVFVVPGNHDVYGQTISTLSHTSLGILERTGVVTILSRDDSPVYIGKANDPDYPLLAFTGQESYQEIDTGVNNDYEVEYGQADLQILIAHGMLLERPFHPDVHSTLISNVTTSADLIMSGHYHPDAINTIVNNPSSNTGTTRFIKPRAVARLEATKHNVAHKPQYCIVEIDKVAGNVSYDVTFHEFASAEDGSKIFDYDGQVEEKLYRSTLNAFKEKIQSVDLTNTTDLPSMLKKIAQAEASITTEHIQKSLQYLSLAERTDSKKALDGYVALPYNIQIAKVELINFQSHENTVVEFSPNSLNALIGESDNGKTAILRCIEWVLYNEPKGADFIREGAKFVEGRIHMTNGNIITRRRTNSDTGYYEVYDAAAGKTERYTKFGQSVPVEIFNAHQMPLIQLGKNNESINISKQLESPFLLSKSGAERASIIGKITKTDVVDDAIAAISKDIANAQRTIKSSESEIDDLTTQLEKYDYLQEEEKKLDTIKAIIDNYQSLQSKISKLTTLQEDLNDNTVEIRLSELVIQKLGNIEQIGKGIDSIEEELRRYNNLILIDQQIKDVEQEIELAHNIISTSIDYEAMSNDITNIESLIKQLEELKACESSYSSVTNSLEKGHEYIRNIKISDDATIKRIDDAYAEVKDLMEKLDAYEYYQSQLEKCETAISQEKEFIEKQEALMKSLEEEYNKELKEMGKCPVCGNSILDDFHCDI